VSDVDYKRGSTYSRSIRIVGLDTQVLTGGRRRKASRKQTIYIVFGEARVFQGIVRSFSMELERRLVLHEPNLVRLGSTDNRNGLR
jgi:hypothetical protein